MEQTRREDLFMGLQRARLLAIRVRGSDAREITIRNVQSGRMLVSRVECIAKIHQKGIAFPTETSFNVRI